MRACIGRAFAWQEALLVTAMVLQNFDLSLDDPKYEMQIQQTLTIKPKNFFMRASLRNGITATQLQDQLQSSSSLNDELRHRKINGVKATPSDDPNSITILYGSNTGTCQAFAQKLASQAAQFGYTTSVQDMDLATSKLPTDRPVLILTASYEGQAPDNAARFVAWLESLKDKEIFKGLKYAVFGCGHRDWSSTYQRIPTLVDDTLLEFGGSRIIERGISDAANRDMFGDFDSWTEELWPALQSVNGKPKPVLPQTTMAPSIDFVISTQERAAHLQQDLQWAKVVGEKLLTAPDQPEKRHLEVQLPTNVTYQVGDYLAVLPLNPEETVKRVIQQFGLPWDGIITVTNSGATLLPANEPLPISSLLKGYVELNQPATRRVSDHNSFTCYTTDLIHSIGYRIFGSKYRRSCGETKVGESHYVT